MSNYTDLTIHDGYASFVVKEVRFYVSTQDIGILDLYNWGINSNKSKVPYISTTTHNQIMLHRLIMNPPKGMTVDHINGDVTDNRRENLRLCTPSQNAKNRGMRKDNTTGYKGVSMHPNGKYRAQIKHDNKKIHIGTYATPHEAYKAYCEASKIYHGDYGRQVSNETSKEAGYGV